jgi:hypothetical protein
VSKAAAGCHSLSLILTLQTIFQIIRTQQTITRPVLELTPVTDQLVDSQ